MLQYRLGLPPNDMLPIKQALNKLELRQELVRHYDVETCLIVNRRRKSFSDFYVRVKTFAESVDICKVADTQGEETQLKQVLLMGVRDQELVKELIKTIAIQTLDETEQQCYAFEATRQTTSAILSLAKSICAMPRYQTETKQATKVADADQEKV